MVVSKSNGDFIVAPSPLGKRWYGRTFIGADTTLAAPCMVVVCIKNYNRINARRDHHCIRVNCGWGMAARYDNQNLYDRADDERFPMCILFKKIVRLPPS